MNWILLAVGSSMLLGIYDITKKRAAHGNAVPAVLLISVCVGALLWIPLVTWASFDPTSQPITRLRVEPLSYSNHGLIVLKSILVGFSWTCSLFALKHLPLSIAAPIRSSSPLWTIAIATLFLGERPSIGQWVGIAIVLLAFWRFSILGSREGINFRRDRWVGCMILATLSGAVSSIYDKYLLQTALIPPATLQAWFSIDLVPVMVPLFLWWFFYERSEKPFHFHWSILAISPLLLTADMLYFTAVADPEALISVISTVRRCSVVVAFAYGARYLQEAQWRPKAWCVAAILLGVMILTCAP